MDGTARVPREQPRQAPVDPRRYREAVGRFPTGVTVVTAHLDGHHHGMTANSFTSVSLDPVLVLICVERSANLHDLILAVGEWGVSLLRADQEHVSRLLARRGRPLGEGLSMVAHHPGPLTGAALLDDALATFECRTVTTFPGGDHTVLVGEVLGIATPRPDASPLVYYRGEYRTTDW